MPGRLTYTALCSLDGYIEDAGGGFGWGAPDAEVHDFVNERERGVGLIDEVVLLVSPVAVGGGKPALPAGARIDLALIEECRFEAGVVFLRYRVDD